MNFLSKINLKSVLALAAVICLMACIAIIVWAKPNEAVKDCILVLVGTISASYKDVYGYYFGASEQPKKLDDDKQ